MLIKIYLIKNNHLKNSCKILEYNNNDNNININKNIKLINKNKDINNNKNYPGILLNNQYLIERDFEKIIYLFEISVNYINYQIKVYNLTYEYIKGKNAKVYGFQKLEKFTNNSNNFQMIMIYCIIILKWLFFQNFIKI